MEWVMGKTTCIYPPVGKKERSLKRLGTPEVDKEHPTHHTTTDRFDCQIIVLVFNSFRPTPFFVSPWVPLVARGIRLALFPLTAARWAKTSTGMYGEAYLADSSAEKLTGLPCKRRKVRPADTRVD